MTDETESLEIENTQGHKAVRLVILGFTAAFFILLALLMSSCSSGESDESAADSELGSISDVSLEDSPWASKQLDLSPTDLDGIPADEKLTAFALEDAEGLVNKTPELSKDQETAITKALEDAQKLGDLSVVFLNVNTGKGISFAADKTVYGASSLKGPYAVYVCQQFVETGEVSLSDAVPLYSTNKGATGVDPSQLWITLSADGTASIEDLITSTIVNSDNSAFGMLRNEFDTKGWDEWAESLGVTDTPFDPTSWFAWYTARSSAKFWLNSYEYFESGTETATWLKPLFEQTNVSFLRDGVEGTGAAVFNKAGWCGNAGSNFDSTCDAGIITLDGQTYIMSIMSGAPDSSSSHDCVSALAKALLSAHETLD